MSRIEKEADGSYKVFYKNKDGESSVKAGIVMFGTGRSPNTKNIGLEVRSHPRSCNSCPHGLQRDAASLACCFVAQPSSAMRSISLLAQA